MEIRQAAMKDAEAIAEIRRQDGVRECVMALSSDRLDVTEDFLRSLTERDAAFVAVYDGRPVGLAVMLANKEECRSHSAFITVMVDRDFQKRGIGGALLSRLTECADRERGLRRLELLVLTDNENAIKLYKRHGFQVEATKRRAAVVKGRFADEYLMGRLHEEGAAK